ncbi:MAG: DUF1573 domain-containing protein [Bacteroidetes bacterium]|nr:MAG: DUF1573 domain-containing protein [Bacteroidota bacterium]
MKKILLTMFIAGAAFFGTKAQESAAVGEGPKIEFEKEVHDFGTLKQYGDATTEFVFKNTGDAPLIITNARGSCGCTVPSWPKEPIKPGESASIKVKYDSKRVGPINKSVTVQSNAVNEPTKILRIKGMIEAAPKENTAPVKPATEGAPVEK